MMVGFVDDGQLEGGAVRSAYTKYGTEGSSNLQSSVYHIVTNIYSVVLEKRVYS